MAVTADVHRPAASVCFGAHISGLTRSRCAACLCLLAALRTHPFERASGTVLALSAGFEVYRRSGLLDSPCRVRTVLAHDQPCIDAVPSPGRCGAAV